MKTKLVSILILALAVILLFSCGTRQETRDVGMDFSAVQTQAVATFAAGLTQTAEALPTLTFTPTLEPTFTVTPTPTGELPATPTKNACYKLLWIADLTVPDGSVLKANERFTKTWLALNNGGCAWAPGFVFSNVGGDPMGAAPLKLQKPVPSGAKYEISIEMVAPSGVYGLIQSSWRMSYEPGMYFGDTLSVNIIIEDPNAASPSPAPTP